MKNIFKKISDFSEKLAELPFWKSLLLMIFIALFLTVVAEGLARWSFIGLFLHIFTSPLIFIVNFLIIFFTLAIGYIIPKRIPYLFIVSILWLGFGIANSVVLQNRANPLSAIDLLVLKSVFTMLDVYYGIFQIVAMIAVIVLVVAFAVFLFFKFPKSKIMWCRSIFCIGVAFVAIWLGTTIIAVDVKDDDRSEYDLAETYEKYGFAYCFARSFLVHGVDKPVDYSEGKVDEIIDAIAAEDETLEVGGTVRPNIIYVQLESFFDPKYVIGLEYSSDPTPNFTRLKAEGVSGYLRMANVGGGTANTEFEILTGMNLDHFGFGEYPYTTVLKNRGCESMAANLKSVGYTAHAMHNHIADFYDRDNAYASLGFDTFTPVEMMRNVTRNPLGWAKDEVLCGEILAALDSTDTPDFVFAVSVQAHGKYPDTEIDTDGAEYGGYEGVEDFVTDAEGAIAVSGIEDEATKNQFTYYVNQIYEMDTFIGGLMDALEERGEPTVLVVYGDHMPALPLDDDDVINGDIYQTEYAVWSNYEMESAADIDDINSLDRDMEAYQLSAYIQKLCSMSVGNITRLHQSPLTSEKVRDEYLRILEYSQLYSEKDSYPPADMTWGAREIIVYEYKLFGNTLYISGEGFNEYSQVIVNGFRRDAVYINEHTIAVENLIFSVNDVRVVQMAAGIGEIYRAIPK